MPRKLSERRAATQEKPKSAAKRTIQKPPAEAPQIGVFVCQFGSNISSVINVDELTKYAETLSNVVHAENMNYPCSRQGQERIVASIKNNRLNRVVVAGCSPRLYQPTFQNCVSQ